MTGFRFQNYFCCFMGVLLLMISIKAAAQPLNFIHLQTENGQPYEVAWNGRNYASSANGYLVIPQVAAGRHTLNIGFTDETGTTAEFTFTVEIEDKPRGFSLRQAIDNSWSLFDMVDLTLLKGAIVVPVIKAVVPDLAPASVKEDKPLTKPAELPAIKKEPLVVKEKTNIKPISILKIFDKSSSTGIDQVYVVTNGAKSDTIALFIPVITEKNKPDSGSNPSAWMPDSNPSYRNGQSKTIFTRPRYLLLSK